MGVWDAGEGGEEGWVDDVFVDEGEEEGGEGQGGDEWRRHWTLAVSGTVECCLVLLTQCDRCCFLAGLGLWITRTNFEVQCRGYFIHR